MNIENKDQPEAQLALIWLVFSEYTLTIRQLVESAGVDPNAVLPFDPGERLHDPYNDILEILGILVTIFDLEADHVPSVRIRVDIEYLEEVKEPVDLSQRVRYAHFSVKKYLKSGRIKDGVASKLGVSRAESNYFFVECFICYILYLLDGIQENQSTETWNSFHCYGMLVRVGKIIMKTSLGIFRGN